MSKLGELICEFCSNGVETVKIKNAFQRLKGTPITAARMKEINNPEGEIKVFAGGKTVITAKEKDIPNANIIRVPAVLVQSRGVIDVIYYECFILGKHTARNGVAGISPPRREFQKC